MRLWSTSSWLQSNRSLQKGKEPRKVNFLADLENVTFRTCLRNFLHTVSCKISSRQWIDGNFHLTLCSVSLEREINRRHVLRTADSTPVTWPNVLPAMNCRYDVGHMTHLTHVLSAKTAITGLKSHTRAREFTLLCTSRLAFMQDSHCDVSRSQFLSQRNAVRAQFLSERNAVRAQ